MTSIQDFLVPVAELLGVIAAAIVLVSLLVGIMVAALDAFSRTGPAGPYPVMLALRILTGYRDASRKAAGPRLVPVSGQNFIAMVGTAIGVWALIVVLSVMGGFEADLKGKIVRQSPHVTLRPAGDEMSGVVDALLAERLRDLDHVVATGAFVEGEAMLTSMTNMSPGMRIYGIRPDGPLAARWVAPATDPVAMEALSEPVLVMSDRELGFDTGDAQGSGNGAARADPVMPPIPAGASTRGRIPPGILLGEELARSLSVAEGDKVTVVVPNGDIGPMGIRPRTRVLRVVGTFMSGMYEYDLRTAYMAISDARDLFLLGGPNRLAVMVDDIDDVGDVAADVRKAVGNTAYLVRTVAEENRSLFSALEIEKIAMFMVLGLVILVAAFNVFGSLLLITMEKTRDIAVMVSLGATRNGIRAVFLMLGGAIGLVGTGAGLVLGLGSCLYIALTGIRLPSEYYLRTLPVDVQAVEVLLVGAAAMGAALVSTLYPAGVAAGLSPSEGLRND